MIRNYRLILNLKNVRLFSNINETVVSTNPVVNTKLLKVAIIGTPNAGKSTLINSLMDRKVCATSSKVHTTRAKSMAIFTENNAQIVFLDTPGLVNIKESKRYNLGRTFLKDSKSSLEQADLIGVIHDVSNEWTNHRIDIKVIMLLEKFKEKRSFLVFNKVDVLKSKRKLLDLTRLCTENTFHGKPIMDIKKRRRNSDNDDENHENRGWAHFEEIFMISALTGDGVQDLRNYLTRNAKPGEWMFPPEVWTDQTPEDLIVNSVKAKFLDYLPQEIPYQLKPKMEYFDINENGVVSTVVLVDCPSSRIAKLVAGESNGRLRQINESVQYDLQHMFQTFVKIKIVLEAKDQK